MTEIIELSLDDIEEIKTFFKEVFCKEPWNDDWSDENQLHNYIKDLAANPNSLSFGLFEDDIMLGLSMGNIKHWYSGTEYYIDEFCIKTEEQGRGLGKCFLEKIEEYILQLGICMIFLQTERNVPAYSFYLRNGFFELKDHVSFVKRLR